MRIGTRLPVLVALVVAAATFVVRSGSADAATPGQVVTVQAASSGSTTAALDLWTRRADGSYRHDYGPVLAHVGYAGVGVAREDLGRTPAGVFGLTQAFGNQPNNGTRLPYFQAGPRDWWDENPSSPTYNSHVVRSSSPGGDSENLYYSGFVYSHAVNIDYNTARVPGAGSAFFLHVTDGGATGGCVAIPSAQLDTVMRWLNPASHPVISIGVGAAATSILHPAAGPSMTGHNPLGYLDSAVGGRGTVGVNGWAADPDNMSAQLAVDIYIDGRFRARLGTGVARPDVARVMHAGPRQGYTATITSVSPGRHTVCAYALNIGPGTTNPSLGCHYAISR